MLFRSNTAGVDTSLKCTGVEEVGVDQGILAFGSFHVSTYWLCVLPEFFRHFFILACCVAWMMRCMDVICF